MNTAMAEETDVSQHYSSGKLMERLRAVLAAEGIDPDRPTVEQLALFDHFHGRGLEATEQAANLVSVQSTDHILDVGSGIGGPARYFAHRFGCRVTGIDLTAEFCVVARVLTRAVGLADRIAFEQGNALATPFPDARFDGAYSLNVSMNIADKAGLYREIHRVLKPGAWFVLAEVAQGPAGDPTYPTPWAKTAETSFLATPDETRQSLADAGFAVVRSRDTAADAAAFTARTRAMIERGEKPPFQAIQVIHGDLARQMAGNGARDLAAGKIIPIEILCRR
jgi:SAM-dependent methyltransferase